MTFPLLKFWRYSPIGLLAAILWNTCELIGITCPFAPHVFGLIMGKSKKPKMGGGGV